MNGTNLKQQTKCSDIKLLKTLQGFKQKFYNQITFDNSPNGKTGENKFKYTKSKITEASTSFRTTIQKSLAKTSQFKGDILKNYNLIQSNTDLLRVKMKKIPKIKLSSDQPMTIAPSESIFQGTITKTESDEDADDTFEYINPCSIQMQNEIKKDLSSHFTYFNCPFPEIIEKHNKFYSNKENKINFVDDIYDVPNLSNNLSLNQHTKTKTHQKFFTRLNFRDNLDHLNSINLINSATKVTLNKLKHKIQIEKDAVQESLQLQKIKQHLRKYSLPVEQIEIPDEDDFIYNDYFNVKYKQFRDVGIPNEKEYTVIRNIHPQQRAKELARRLFKGFLHNAIKTSYTFEEVIMKHIDHHNISAVPKAKKSKLKNMKYIDHHNTSAVLKTENGKGESLNQVNHHNSSDVHQVLNGKVTDINQAGRYYSSAVHQASNGKENNTKHVEHNTSAVPKTENRKASNMKKRQIGNITIRVGYLPKYLAAPSKTLDSLRRLYNNLN